MNPSWQFSFDTW